MTNTSDQKLAHIVPPNKQWNTTQTKIVGGVDLFSVEGIENTCKKH